MAGAGCAGERRFSCKPGALFEECTHTGVMVFGCEREHEWSALGFAAVIPTYGAVKTLATLRRRLLRSHAQRAVQANHLTVEHRSLYDVRDERSVLFGPAEPRGKWYL